MKTLLEYRTFLLVWKDIEGPKAMSPPPGVCYQYRRRCYFEWQHEWERVRITLKAQYWHCPRCEMYRVDEMKLSELLPVVGQ